MVKPSDMVAVGDIIVSRSNHYEVEKILGSGAFGVVSLCHKRSTNQKVALKMVREDPTEETAMLQTLMDHGGVSHNIVEWFGSFEFKGHYVHEFEVLDMHLLTYIKNRGKLQIREIRPIVHQMGTALSFLKRQGIVHRDLKRDNIMMVDTVSKPLKIKLIDFGLAKHVSQIQPGSQAQTRGHRAPEVFLGAPYNEAIDMWSVGCIVVELFIGRLLFHGDDTYETFCNIIKTLGVPTLKLLKRSKYTDKYLIYKDRRWLFRKSGKIAPIISSLAKVYSYMPKNEADQCDFEFFRDLVKLMLKLDPADRVTPDELLKHPFVTMDHLRKFRNLHPDFVSECLKLSCAALADEVTIYSQLDDDEWDSTSSEELSGPKMSSDQGQSGAPSRKRRWEEKQDTMYGKRLCEEQAPAPEGPSSCQKSAPAPEGPSRSAQTVARSMAVRRKRRHETEAESSDLDLDVHCCKRLCEEPAPAPEGPSSCQKSAPAPEGPSRSGQSVARSMAVRRKRRHETEAESSGLDLDVPCCKRLCVRAASTPRGPSRCEESARASDGPSVMKQPLLLKFNQKSPQ